jgi:Amt family ammonium transporter
VATLITWVKDGKPDVAMAGNGLLAGLVGITAGCAGLSNWYATLTGAIAGALVVGAVYFFDRVKVDDPVGAVSVHGVCGAWGVIAVGLFATEDGLFDGGGTDLLVTQLIGVVAIAAFVAVTMAIIFFAIKAVVGLRVSPQEELEGLDVHEHGYPGYGIDVAAGMGDEVLVGALAAEGK